MIRPALIVGLALALAACGGNDADTANDAVADAGLEQEDVITNDVTAIDAATADSAGMAADLAPPTGNDIGNGTTAPSRRDRRTTSSGSDSDAEANTAAPAPSETAEPEPVAGNEV